MSHLCRFRHSLTHSLTYCPVLFSPEFRLVASLRLFPPHPSQHLSASKHAHSRHAPSFPPSRPSHPCTSQKTSLMQNFQSVLLSNAHLLHNLPDPDAPRIRNQAYESLADVLDLVVRVQEADVPLHDRLCLCLERWFVGLRSGL